MEIKGVPFGYLEFSRAIRGETMPIRAPEAAAGRCRSRAGSGSGLGSGSLPGSVLFEPDLTGMDYRGSYPLRHPDPNCPAQLLSANRREQLGGCYLKRTVATVQIEPLQPFGWVRTDLPLPERYK